MITNGLGMHSIVAMGLGGYVRKAIKIVRGTFRKAKPRITIAKVDKNDDEEILAIES